MVALLQYRRFPHCNRNYAWAIVWILASWLKCHDFQYNNSMIKYNHKASFIELFIDPLVASCITHLYNIIILYALVCDNLDVTFGIKVGLA